MAAKGQTTTTKEDQFLQIHKCSTYNYIIALTDAPALEQSLLILRQDLDIVVG